MADEHSGIIELTRLVAELEGNEFAIAARERAVALALHLYAADEISRMKCLDVARAAGSTTPALDAAVRIVENEWRGEGPPDWAESPVPLRLDEAALAKIAQMVNEPRPPCERLRAAARRHRRES
jgi:hypothetical protein